MLARNVALEGDLRSERFGTPAIQSALSGAHLADVLSQIGRFDEAIGHAEAAVEIAEALDTRENCQGCARQTRPTDRAVEEGWRMRQAVAWERAGLWKVWASAF
jgi:hypothetical protein